MTRAQLQPKHAVSWIAGGGSGGLGKGNKEGGFGEWGGRV